MIINHLPALISGGFTFKLKNRSVIDSIYNNDWNKKITNNYVAKAYGLALASVPDYTTTSHFYNLWLTKQVFKATHILSTIQITIPDPHSILNELIDKKVYRMILDSGKHSLSEIIIASKSGYLHSLKKFLILFRQISC